MTFFQAAIQGTIVKRSLKIAAVVGTILVAINYGDKFYPLQLTSADWIKMALTYCVPYCVSTYSAASTLVANQN
ncbi:MAG: nitrate/nitrite transporter NrtS [Pseudomonadota bacterium]